MFTDLGILKVIDSGQNMCLEKVRTWKIYLTRAAKRVGSGNFKSFQLQLLSELEVSKTNLPIQAHLE